MQLGTYDQSLVLRVVSVIGEGGIVAAPTDTVYGLLADATNEVAVRNVFKIKQRPESKPLPVLVHSIAMAEEFSELPHDAAKVAHHFWVDEKRPLTMIAHLIERCNNRPLPKQSVHEDLEGRTQHRTTVYSDVHEDLSSGSDVQETIEMQFGKKSNKIGLAESVRAGEGTVAVRVPNSTFLIDVMTMLGRPLVAPSANIHGQPPATSYHSAVTSFGSYISDTFMIVDGGESECTSASTIIDVSQGSYRIVREGPVSENEILEFVRSL
jgi:L-threonylcarbamoyladenylate synthase